MEQRKVSFYDLQYLQRSQLSDLFVDNNRRQKHFVFTKDINTTIHILIMIPIFIFWQTYVSC